MTNSHHHHHIPHFSDQGKSFGAAFAIGAALNISFVLVELFVGFKIKSLALIADAGHNASDVLGLLLAWGAFYISSFKPRGRYTFGFGKATILASLLNAILLVFAAGAISIEAIHRFYEPAPASGKEIMIVAGIGVVINFATAFMFMKGQNHDINIKGTFLHMLFDGLVSFGVIIAGLLIMVTGAQWIDPLIGIIIALVIVFGGWGLLRDSFNMSLGAVPNSIEIAKVEKFFAHFKEIDDFHDLHIWPLSTTETALSVHIIVKNPQNSDDLLEHICEDLEHDFGIRHATIQIENEMKCRLHHHVSKL